jgi:hypothetical protein
MAVLRSHVGYAQQIFAARLPYGGTPDNYVYGGTWDPNDPSVGCDCSGLVTDILSAVFDGPDMPWDREGLSTESYRYLPLGPQQVGPFALLHVGSYSDFPPDAVVNIQLHHEGAGGPQSHMNCRCDGVYMESNGEVGCCTLGTGAMAMSDPYWNDFWCVPGPIINDTGLDYAAPPAPALVAAQFLL